MPRLRARRAPTRAGPAGAAAHPGAPGRPVAHRRGGARPGDGGRPRPPRGRPAPSRARGHAPDPGRRRRPAAVVDRPAGGDRPEPTAPSRRWPTSISPTLPSPAVPLPGSGRLIVNVIVPRRVPIGPCSRAQVRVEPDDTSERLEARPVELSTEMMLPRVWAAPVTALMFVETEQSAYIRLRERVAELQGVPVEDGDAEGVARHHLLGYPTETSGSMPLECELASRGLDLRHAAAQAPAARRRRIRALAAPAAAHPGRGRRRRPRRGPRAALPLDRAGRPRPPGPLRGLGDRALSRRPALSRAARRSRRRAPRRRADARRTRCRPWPRTADRGRSSPRPCRRGPTGRRRRSARGTRRP